LKRPEFIVTLNYDHQFSDHFGLRAYGGFSYSPDSQIYSYTGDGMYKSFDIGQVRSTINDHGNLYVAGTDLLWQTGRCGSVVHFVGGFGLGLMGFTGGIDAQFTPLILGDRPLLTLSGSYWGLGFYGNALAGVRFDFLKHGEITVLGGYRGGLAYMSFTSPIENKDGGLPIYGPFGQVSLGYRF
jgi:hypothetical protein